MKCTNPFWAGEKSGGAGRQSQTSNYPSAEINYRNTESEVGRI